jgi:signal transduction histidine kinase
VNSVHRLPPEVETALFRVVQEAISNISRHAAARKVCILLEYQPGSVCVTVEDDGIGFDTGELSLTPESFRGLGLLGMRERMELLGGSLEINTTPGFGAQIIFRVPVRESELAVA